MNLRNQQQPRKGSMRDRKTENEPRRIIEILRIPSSTLPRDMDMFFSYIKSSIWFKRRLKGKISKHEKKFKNNVKYNI
jgi:hypothetical protein